MIAQPVVYGFLKMHNEVLKGNLVQCLTGMREICAEVLVCDDGSTDGSADAAEVMGARVIRRYAAPDFADEGARKQSLLNRVHNMIALGTLARPDWLLWLDGDEILERSAAASLRPWLATVPAAVSGVTLPYVNLHMTPAWRQQATGAHVRLWRFCDKAKMQIQHTRGITGRLVPDSARQVVHNGPFRVLHYAHVGLQRCAWKYIQYARYKNRHTFARWSFDALVRTDRAWFPPWAEWDDGPAPPLHGPSGDVQRLIENLVHNFGDCAGSAIELAYVVRNTCALADVAENCLDNWIALIAPQDADQRRAARAAARDDPRVSVLRYPDGFEPDLDTLAASLAPKVQHVA